MRIDIHIGLFLKNQIYIYIYKTLHIHKNRICFPTVNSRVYILYSVEYLFKESIIRYTSRGAKLKNLGDYIPRKVFAYVIYRTLCGLFMRIDVHIGLILMNLICKTLNIDKNCIYFPKVNSRE